MAKTASAGAQAMKPELISRFAALVGAGNAVTGPQAQARYLVEPRGLYKGQTPLVLRPGSTDEVAAIMQLATATSTPVVPQGGNTGLVGGQQPGPGGAALIVSLERLNAIRALDRLGKVAVVEAGVVLQTLQERAEAAGCLFPLSLASEGTAQIGGNLSSNAGGTAVLRYGTARDLCLGLEVVLPDGRVLDDLRCVRKDNSGYDLKDLFIGAEGTLGIITAASMKLFALPRGRAVAYAGLASPADALRLFDHVQQHAGWMLTGFELISRQAMQLSLAYGANKREPLPEAHPWYVLLEISSAQGRPQAKAAAESVLSTALDNGMADNAVVAASQAQEAAFWQVREDISPAQKRAGASIKHDISVPVAAFPDFLADAECLVQQMVPGARVVAFGHMGDGNLHYNISQPPDADKERFLSQWQDVNRHIHALVMRYGGAGFAGQGICPRKRGGLLAFKSPLAVELMRGIKQLFDPSGIMNPGKIL